MGHLKYLTAAERTEFYSLYGNWLLGIITPEEEARFQRLKEVAIERYKDAMNMIEWVDDCHKAMPNVSLD